MRNHFRKLTAVCIAASMACSVFVLSAGAYTVTDIDTEHVFTEDLIEAEIPSDWAEKEVERASELGLVPEISGRPGFHDAITREQFAELAVNLVTVVNGKKPELDKAISFSDCDNEKVLLAASAGIVQGVGNGRFAPHDDTNREQIATMLCNSIRYLEDHGHRDLTPIPADLSRFEDADRVSGWARDSVGVLASNSIMKGTSDTILAPAEACTVEQSILLVLRVYNTCMTA